MGSSCIPARASFHIRYTHRDHDDTARATCRSARSSLSSLPCWMGRVLGCTFKPPPPNLTTSNKLQKSTLHDFLTILSDVFAKEPPVISRQQSGPATTQPIQSPPPVPPLPPDMAPRPSNHGPPRPPPPPPKTIGNETPERSTPISRNEGPPLPPVSQSRYDSAPPLPPQAQAPAGPQYQVQHHHISSQHRLSYVSTMSPGGPPPIQHQSHNFHQSPPSHQNNHNNHQGQWNMAGTQNHQQPLAPWSQASREAQPQPQTTHALPPPDLLDEPLTLDIPAQPSVAPPPIPPNPEKDALLVQLARTLASLRQASRQQNESSMAGLQAQRNAMLSVLPTIQSEMTQITQLSNILTSNTAILHDALHKADGVIEGSRSHPAPDIDELLVAPTVVSNQLYTLVAEERALGDAIFMLGRAVERGRISPAVFAKMTRSLAREWYLKKALVRKIGMGMGLA